MEGHVIRIIVGIQTWMTTTIYKLHSVVNQVFFKSIPSISEKLAKYFKFKRKAIDKFFKLKELKYSTGYADEEDRHHAKIDELLQKTKRGGGNGVGNNETLISDDHDEIEDVVDDNLAADFDGSFSGLGVDIHTGSFSMSEALNALPNLSISSSQIFKQEIPSPAHLSGTNSTKVLDHHHSERQSNGGQENTKNYGALDLSNDEAHLPESDHDGKIIDEEGGSTAVVTFTGSVSRESTPSLNFSQRFKPLQPLHQQQESSQIQQQKIQSYTSAANLSASNPNLSSSSADQNSTKKAVILQPHQNSKLTKDALDNMKLEKRSYETIAVSELDTNGSNAASTVAPLETFQYILAASTSIATKQNEPSITYLNQSQAYELRMKKLGDLSSYRVKRLLKCVLRICFHERRLQYMEAEQLAEWSAKHTGERIIDADLPLSYGVTELTRDAQNINSLSFKWDPTRDTGVFIKVNCISTEFTPKKHGGEKGVPFRLQVETYDNESRIHAAGCILQVFKLKGADRKHKQDRDKISKRPQAEQEKYAPSFECTVLTDLQPEHIYVPANLSRPESPSIVSTANPTEVIRVETPVHTKQTTTALKRVDSDPSSLNSSQITEVFGLNIDNALNPSQVSAWLSANRFGSYVTNFRNFNGRDLLRLSREETIALCGPGDGIRLYNCMHAAYSPPKATWYVGSKEEENFYNALYLEEMSVNEVLKKLSDAFGLEHGLLTRAFFIGPKGIYVKFTDNVVRNTKHESVFQFTIRASTTATSSSATLSNGAETSAPYDVVFEEVHLKNEQQNE